MPSGIAVVADVVGCRSAEPHRALRHYDARRAQALLAALGNVLCVEEDAAARRIIETVEQPGHGRFAGTGWTDDCTARHRRDVDVDAFQDVAPVIVAEAHMVEADT